MDHDPVKAAEAMSRAQAFLGLKVSHSSLSIEGILGITKKDREIRKELDKSSCRVRVTAEQVQSRGPRLVRPRPAAPASS